MKIDTGLLRREDRWLVQVELTTNHILHENDYQSVKTSEAGSINPLWILHVYSHQGSEE
mgnify:CR=1 FL=1